MDYCEVRSDEGRKETNAEAQTTGNSTNYSIPNQDLFQLLINREDDDNVNDRDAKNILSRAPDSIGHSSDSSVYPIHIASLKGCLDIIRHILAIDPNQVTKLTKDGALPIHMSALGGHIDVCHLLHRYYPESVTIRTYSGLLPEDISSRAGHSSLTSSLRTLRVEILINAKPRFEVSDSSPSLEISDESSLQTDPINPATTARGNDYKNIIASIQAPYRPANPSKGSRNVELSATITGRTVVKVPNKQSGSDKSRSELTNGSAIDYTSLEPKSGNKKTHSRYHELEEILGRSIPLNIDDCRLEALNHAIEKSSTTFSHGEELVSEVRLHLVSNEEGAVHLINVATERDDDGIHVPDMQPLVEKQIEEETEESSSLPNINEEDQNNFQQDQLNHNSSSNLNETRPLASNLSFVRLDNSEALNSSSTTNLMATPGVSLQFGGGDFFIEGKRSQVFKSPKVISKSYRHVDDKQTHSEPLQDYNHYIDDVIKQTIEMLMDNNSTSQSIPADNRNNSSSGSIGNELSAKFVPAASACLSPPPPQHKFVRNFDIDLELILQSSSEESTKKSVSESAVVNDHWTSQSSGLSESDSTLSLSSSISFIHHTNLKASLLHANSTAGQTISVNMSNGCNFPSVKQKKQPVRGITATRKVATNSSIEELPSTSGFNVFPLPNSNAHISSGVKQSSQASLKMVVLGNGQKESKLSYAVVKSTPQTSSSRILPNSKFTTTAAVVVDEESNTRKSTADSASFHNLKSEMEDYKTPSYSADVVETYGKIDLSFCLTSQPLILQPHKPTTSIPSSSKSSNVIVNSPRKVVAIQMPSTKMVVTANEPSSTCFEDQMTAPDMTDDDI